MSDAPADADAPAGFTCNLCGARSERRRAELTREAPTCDGCGSNVRLRALAHLLSVSMFGVGLPVFRFPWRPRGIGLSDGPAFAAALGLHADYTNTFFHAEPRLDIADPPEALAGSLDFIVSADVFEHVGPPVQRAFDGARRLLKPGGVLLLTVPYDPGAPTIEHFPDLHDYELREEAGAHRLYNRRRDGQDETFDDLVFHGGPGTTLEMRLFGLQDLLEHCRQAGFRHTTVEATEVPEWGIAWLVPWSLPLVARA